MAVFFVVVTEGVGANEGGGVRGDSVQAPDGITGEEGRSGMCVGSVRRGRGGDVRVEWRDVRRMGGELPGVAPEGRKPAADGRCFRKTVDE